MATCLRMPGTEWPREQHAVSGQHPPSITCECCIVLCVAFLPMSLHYLPLTLVIFYNSCGSFIRMGTFHAESPPPKQKIERQNRAPTKEAKRIMPTQVA